MRKQSITTSAVRTPRATEITDDHVHSISWCHAFDRSDLCLLHVAFAAIGSGRDPVRTTQLRVAVEPTRGCRPRFSGVPATSECGRGRTGSAANTRAAAPTRSDFSRRTDRFSVYCGASASWRQISLSRADGEARFRHFHCQVVELPIQLLRRETERVLMMQLVGDAIKGAEQRTG